MERIVNEGERWGNVRHSSHRNLTRRDSLHLSLMRTVPEAPKPIAWDDVSNFKGKNVWGVFEGVRQLLYVVSLAPEGKEGERWYVMPKRMTGIAQFSISKSRLELYKPTTCLALALPEIKTRPVKRVLTTPEIIHL